MPRDDVRLLVGGANEAEVHTTAAVEDEAKAEEIQNDDAGEDGEQTVEQQPEKTPQHSKSLMEPRVFRPADDAELKLGATYG